MGIEVAAVIAGAGVAGSGGVGLGALTLLGGAETIGAYALAAGAVVGGSILLNELRPDQHQSEQQTVKQALPPRQRIYGRALVAGSYYFFLSTGPILVTGLVLCEGPISRFVAHYFNDLPSPNTSQDYGSPNMWPWFGQVDFYAQKGKPDQQRNTSISDVFSFWNADHRLQGLCNVVVRCFVPPDPDKNFAKYFPSGAPTYRALIDASLVFDPRAAMSWDDETTWAWSDNPALCILNFLTYRRAMNIPHERIDVASFVDMANTCDEQVPLASGDGAGTSQARYRLWGGYTLDEEPKDVLARMLKTCDGELYMTAAGKIALRGGKWTEPTVTIGADIVTGLEAQRGRDKLVKYNQLKIRYTSPAQDFQQVDGDPWDDVPAQNASGEVLPEDFDVVMVPAYHQAQRLAKIRMAKDNPAWILTVTTSVAGLNALGERIVLFDYPDLGIHETFFVNAFEIADDGATCKIGLGSLSAAAYTWSTAEEGNPPGDLMPPQSGPYVPETPTNLVLSIELTKVSSTTSLPSIRASVSPPNVPSVSLTAQYRVAGSADAWRDMTADNVAFTALSPIVSNGTVYEVRVAFKAGAIGSYVTSAISVGQTSVGPVASAMASGSRIDMGRITEAVSVSDTFGPVTETPIITIDLGGLAA